MHTQDLVMLVLGSLSGLLELFSMLYATKQLEVSHACSHDVTLITRDNHSYTHPVADDI